VKTLRCLTLNLWGAEPPLEARMALVATGLRELAPDVVTLQEVREVPGQLPNQAETLAKAAGFGHVFAPATPFATCFSNADCNGPAPRCAANTGATSNPASINEVWSLMFDVRPPSRWGRKILLPLVID